MKTSSAAPPHRGPLRQLLARFRAHAKALAFDKRGGIAIWMALGMPVVFGFAGLGLDVSSWYMDRRIMQSAVDAAAVEAAHALNSGVTDESGLLQAAKSSFARDNYVPGSQPEVSNLPASEFNPEKVLAAVKVVLTRQGMLTFSSLFVSDSGVTIRAQAVGGIVRTENPVCVLALGGALEFSGGGIASFNCGIASNSASSDAILLSGGTTVIADPAQAYGNITINGSATLSKPAQAYAPRIPDPYGPQGRNLQVPPAGACVPAPSINAFGNFTVSPGTYCGDLQIKKGTVTFEPGTYVIDNGDFNIQTDANVSGNDVTFILTGTTPGVIDFSSQAEIDLTAPSSGPYAGVLLFEDPKAPSHPGKHSANGGAGLKLNGAIYTPKREIDFSGGFGTSGQCLQIVAHKVTVTGGGTIQNNPGACKALGAADMEQVRIRLIE
jgi:Putative Flp pilus-assembly TadE/G-like